MPIVAVQTPSKGKKTKGKAKASPSLRKNNKRKMSSKSIIRDILDYNTMDALAVADIPCVHCTEKFSTKQKLSEHILGGHMGNLTSFLNILE